MADERYVIGVDFGTLSGRAVVVRVEDGTEVGSAVHEYAHGVINAQLPGRNRDLPGDWALQDPDDWLAVLATAVPDAVVRSRVDPRRIIGIGTDFTACTVLPTTADRTPLAKLDAWRDRPHAWPKLWKHHAAQAQADRITRLAHERGEPWIARYGGRISSEWQFAKALQVLEEDHEVYAATERWIEAADWIIWQLTGRETRNACTAGYKGIYQDGAYPSEEYLAALNPAFADFARTRLEHPLSPLGSAAGPLRASGAQLTGLPEGITVAVGNVDAHVTAPAAQVVSPGRCWPSWAPRPATSCRRASWPRCPACAASSTAASSPGATGTRPGRAASATSSPGGSTTASRPRTPTRRPHAGSACTST